VVCRFPAKAADPSTLARHLYPGEEGGHNRPVGGLASYVWTVEGAL